MLRHSLVSLCFGQACCSLTHIIMLGETGAGKSTFGNMLLGKEAFKVGHDLSSCTFEIESGVGQIFGSDDAIIEVSDTGGLGDSEGRDEAFVDDIARHVRKKGGVHGIIYVHNACNTRINQAAQESLLRMFHTLADNASSDALWSRVAFALTRCPERHPFYESGLPRELKKRFHVTHSPPMFSISDPNTTFLNRALVKLREMWVGRSWQDDIKSWLGRLPHSPFQIPNETTHESMRRNFEANRQRELEEQRLIREEIERLQQEALESKRRMEEEQQRMEQMRLKYEQEQARIQEEARLAKEREMEEMRRNYEAEQARVIEAARIEQERQVEEMRREYEQKQARVQEQMQIANRRQYSYTPPVSYGGGRSSGGGCFSSSSRVMVEGVGSVSLNNLKVGQRVASGTGWTEVVAWMHNDASAQADEGFEIGFDGGKLVLTTDHLVFVQRTNLKRVAVVARHIRAGDYLLSGPNLHPVIVTSTMRVQMNGYHAPLTASGDILVDGVLASCYIEVGLSHNVIQAMTWFWRWPSFPKWLRPSQASTWIAIAGLLRSFVGLHETDHLEVKRVLLVGETGAGKSTLGNTILGSYVFDVGHSLVSSTSRVQAASGRLFGSGFDIEVIDSGGLGDSENRDARFLEDIVKHLRSFGGVHGIVYVQSACRARIDQAIQTSFKQTFHALSQTFSDESLWERVSFAFTQCSHNDEYGNMFFADFRKHVRVPASLEWFTVDETWSWRTSFKSWLANLPNDAWTVPVETARERGIREEILERSNREKHHKDMLRTKMDLQAELDRNVDMAAYYREASKQYT